MIRDDFTYQTASASWLGVPFWGQGIMPEAVREIIRYSFVDKQLTTLWCGYFDGNVKSKRVQEKCGFVYDHTNKDIHWKLMDDIRTNHISILTRDAWQQGFTVRKLADNEINDALQLAWEVFSEYESPDYLPEGTEEFRKCLYDENYLSGMEYYGTYDGDTLIGEIAIRRQQKHICFFFVNGNYHRLGIGTRMFRHLLTMYPNAPITLNSSPYGLPFYKALGLTPTAEEQTVHGIRFTPMMYSPGGNEDL